MARYHDTGTVCKAEMRACPLGLSDGEHIEADSLNEFEEKLSQREALKPSNTFLTPEDARKRANLEKLRSEFSFIKSIAGEEASRHDAWVGKEGRIPSYSDEVRPLFNSQWRLATSPKTSVEELDMLADSPFKGVRYEVASNPNTSPSTLAKLSEDGDYDVVGEVTVNPNTPPEVLESLWKSGYVAPYMIGTNPSTPKEILDEIARFSEGRYASWVALNKGAAPETLEAIKEKAIANGDLHIIKGLAYNTSTSRETLGDFLNHENAKIRIAARRNPSSPTDFRDKLSLSPNVADRISAAEDVDTNPYTLEDLSTDSDSEVRLAVARNPFARKETLIALRKDEDPVVRKAAKQNPNGPSVFSAAFRSRKVEAARNSSLF